MNRLRLPLLFACGLALAAGLAPRGVAAQAAPGGATDTAATPAPMRHRADWLSDGRALAVGDLLTIVVDEQTAASERVSRVASGDRDLSAGLNAGIATDARVGPVKGFRSGVRNSSRDVGEASRRGDLVSLLTVRVVGVEPNGTLRIAGGKRVLLDGREQEVRVEGLVRPTDVERGNQVASARIAEATITYRGKKIGPTTGILGKILGILWP
jgi:flagellar L-ring protein FlgH